MSRSSGQSSSDSNSAMVDSRRVIPPVFKLLESPEVMALTISYGRALVRVQLDRVLDELRAELGAGTAEGQVTPDLVAARIERHLVDQLGAPARRVLNATGVLLHTNLGRAPLPSEVLRDLESLLDASCDLEMDLATGRRGDRSQRIERLLRALTGAPAAIAVNNNAAALVLALSTLAKGRDVIVSRGELVEIGGSFRIPEILEASGARLMEVGSTNRTRLDDYRRGLTDQTALLLKVFPSNYRIEGFTEEVSVEQLVALSQETGVPLLVDEGSGLLRPNPTSPLEEHLSLAQLVELGADLACGSGDKLAGGPQAGLIVGATQIVEKLRKHPLYRALRPGRAVLVLLERVLRLHLRELELPLDRLLLPGPEHTARLERVAARVEGEIIRAEGYLGGGSAPQERLLGEAIALDVDSGFLDRLRIGDPPVVGYWHDGRVVLDLRTVAPKDDDALVEAVLACRRDASAREGIHDVDSQ